MNLIVSRNREGPYTSQSDFFLAAADFLPIHGDHCQATRVRHDAHDAIEVVKPIADGCHAVGKVDDPLCAHTRGPASAPLCGPERHGSGSSWVTRTEVLYASRTATGQDLLLIVLVRQLDLRLGNPLDGVRARECRSNLRPKNAVLMLCGAGASALVFSEFSARPHTRALHARTGRPHTGRETTNVTSPSGAALSFATPSASSVTVSPFRVKM